MDRLKDLANYGLYSPEHEHDGCGVGVVANIKGGKSHRIIEDGLQVLVNLGHRGAAGCDPFETRVGPNCQSTGSIHEFRGRRAR